MQSPISTRNTTIIDQIKQIRRLVFGPRTKWRSTDHVVNITSPYKFAVLVYTSIQTPYL